MKLSGDVQLKALLTTSWPRATSGRCKVQGYLAQGLLTHRQRSLRYEFAECCSEGPLQAMTVISALAL